MNNKISVIVAVYNGNSKHYNIKRTLDSVLNQTYKNFEIIVIDGGSTDGTVEIIKNYAKKGKIDYFVSEKDKGIYDAMNKGIKASKGEWLYFLNSDDCLFDNKVFSKVAKEFDENTDLVCGATCFFNGKKLLKDFENFSIFNLKLGIYPRHQGTIFNRNCFRNQMYSLEYSICSDSDFFAYCGKNKFKAKNCPNLIIAKFDLNGVGTAQKHVAQSDKIIIKRWGLIFLILRKFFIIFKWSKSKVGYILTKVNLYNSKNILSSELNE